MNKAIYFSGTQCSVCHALLPKVQQLFADEYPQMALEVCEVAEQPELAAKYSVFTVPVLIVLIEGKEYARFVRNFSPSQIREKLDRLYQLYFGE